MLVEYSNCWVGICGFEFEYLELGPRLSFGNQVESEIRGFIEVQIQG